MDRRRLRVVGPIRYEGVFEAMLSRCRRHHRAGGIAVGTTHPEHYVRSYAHWLFSESDLYASITGIGSGSRSIQEVTDILQKLVGIRPQPVPVKPSFPIAPSPERFATPITHRATDDPLEDERRDLLARFEELERWIGR